MCLWGFCVFLRDGEVMRFVDLCHINAFIMIIFVSVNSSNNAKLLASDNLFSKKHFSKKHNKIAVSTRQWWSRQTVGVKVRIDDLGEGWVSIGRTGWTSWSNSPEAKILKCVQHFACGLLLVYFGNCRRLCYGLLEGRHQCQRYHKDQWIH